MNKRYWLDPNFYYGDFAIPKFALHEVSFDEDGDEVDNIILWACWHDFPNFDDDLAFAWDTLDSFIEKELGFLPDYEVG